MYSANQSSEDQAKIAEEQAAAKRLQAAEYWQRAQSKAEDFLAQGQSVINRQRELYASANVEGGSTIDVITGGWHTILDSYYEQLDDASYNARMIELGANIDASTANAYRRSGDMQMGGILLSVVAQGTSVYNKIR
jgi:hypothetical protein